MKGKMSEAVKPSKIAAAALLALVALLMLGVCAWAQDNSTEGWLEQGNELIANGSYEEAVSAFDKVIQTDPNNKIAWLNEGAALTRLNKTDEALKAYQEALEITNKTLEANPQDAMAWSEKGLLLHNVGDYEGAVEAFDNATNIDPENEIAWKMKGVILASELHRYDEAVKAFDTALKINPEDAPVWNLKGDALKALGRQADADGAYAKAEGLGHAE